MRVNLGLPDPNDQNRRRYETYEDVAMATYPELSGKSPEELKKLLPRYVAVVKREAEKLAKWLTEDVHDTESSEFAADTKLIRQNYTGYITGAALADLLLRPLRETDLAGAQNLSGTDQNQPGTYDLSEILGKPTDAPIPLGKPRSPQAPDYFSQNLHDRVN